MGIVSEGRRITCRREVVCLLNSVPPPGSFFTLCQQEQLFSCRVLFTHDLLLNFLFLRFQSLLLQTYTLLSSSKNLPFIWSCFAVKK